MDPILVKKAKQASLFGNLLLWSKSYFTSVAIQFEKKDKTLQNFPNVKFFHQAKEERKPERNLISDEVSILNSIAFNIYLSILFIVLPEGSIGDSIIL